MTNAEIAEKVMGWHWVDHEIKSRDGYRVWKGNWWYYGDTRMEYGSASVSYPKDNGPFMPLTKIDHAFKALAAAYDASWHIESVIPGSDSPVYRCTINGIIGLWEFSAAEAICDTVLQFMVRVDKWKS